MLRFTAYALPLLILLLALFGFAVEVLDLEPAGGATIRLAILEQSRIPAFYVLLAWLMEACGLMALFLVCQGRTGAWWLDGLLSGWLAWVFRGPLLVLTVAVAAHQSQQAWWKIVFGWWILYSVCGLTMAALARGLGETETDLEAASEAAAVAALAMAAPVIAAAALAEEEAQEAQAAEEAEASAAADMAAETTGAETSGAETTAAETSGAETSGERPAATS